MANNNQLKFEFKKSLPKTNGTTKVVNTNRQVKVIDISNRSAIYKRIIGRTN